MVSKHDMKKIHDWLWEIPKSYRTDMRVDARLYVDERFLDRTLQDNSVEQLVNTATLPGIIGPALAMPDIHEGYGFPIGGVVAVRHPDGVISPGGVGYDINCGVRLLASHVHIDELHPHKDDLITAIYYTVPSGVGSTGGIKLSPKQMDQVLSKGAAWVISQGYGNPDDLERLESQGCMAEADPDRVGKRARERGKDQLGTLGSGNHFLEIDQVTKIFDRAAAETFGLFEGQVVIQIHSGSRGLGHQVCDDYIRVMQQAVRKYQIELPDRQLGCAPINSPEGQDYLSAMAAAANFAWANRQMMASLVQDAFAQILAGHSRNRDLYTVYDVAHNIAKIEMHTIDGKQVKVCVHRKGATRAFGPGHPELPASYRESGQPVLVPGDMGTASFVLVGTAQAMEKSFGSCCHGAGRVLSRKAAQRQVDGADLQRQLTERGIAIRAGKLSGLAEEAPQAYKEIDHVVDTIERAELARKVARLEPIAVMKG